MPKSHFFQSSFVSGELSPLLIGRTDLQQYYQGTQVAENVLIVPQGGLKRRPGTEFVATALPSLEVSDVVPTMPNGGSASFINDGNDDTYTATTTALDSTPVYVVAEYDLLSTQEVEFVDVVNISLVLDNNAVAQCVVQWSTDQTIWSDFAFFPINKTEKTVRFLFGGGRRYWRLIVSNASGLGNNVVKLAGFNLLSKSTSFSYAKTFDFSIETDRHYLCVLTDRNLRIYRSPFAGSTTTDYVADVRTPYLSAEVSAVRDAQTENVMLMFHENHAPIRIINDGASLSTSFGVDKIPFLSVPQYDFNDSLSPSPTPCVQQITFNQSTTAGDRYQIDIDGVLSKSISYAGHETTDAQEATTENLRKNLQEMPIFGDTGITVEYSGIHNYTITIDGDSAGTYSLFTAFVTAGTDKPISFAFINNQKGTPRKENVWSSTRGWPKMGVFHDGRLWLGATRDKTQSLFASRSGSFFDFFSEEGDDDEGIFITLTSRNLTNIVDINSDRGLQVFTAGAEFLVKGNTPSTIEVVSQTQHGALNLEVKAIDGATLFVDQNGKSLRQYLYNYNEDAYTSNDISVLSSQLINQPVDVAVLTGTTSEDSNWVFLINQDGKMAVLNTVRSQDINGFTRWSHGDTDSMYPLHIVSASVVGNDLYLVSRKTKASTVDFIVDKINFNYMLDSSVKIPLVSQSIVDLGTNHLDGQTVQVLADGLSLADRIVTNGTITLTSFEYADTPTIEVGRNFIPTIVPMPINTATPMGQNQMREKKIVRMNMRVYNSANVAIDGNLVPIRAFGPENDSALNSTIVPETGIIQDNNGGKGWGIDVVPTITVPYPSPFHLQAIEYEVESS